MRALTFWKTVVADTADFLDRLIALLAEHGIRDCVVGGQAVNAYVEPVVSLDLDLAVAIDQLGRVEELMREAFVVERFPHRLNVSLSGSDLRVQIQTDPRYASFVDRATPRDVLGLRVTVAGLIHLPPRDRTVQCACQGALSRVRPAHRPHGAHGDAGLAGRHRRHLARGPARGCR